MHHTHINTVHLLGDVCDPPGWRSTQTGRSLYFFRVATRRGMYTEYHQIMVVDPVLAKKLDDAKLAKGAVVELSGHLKYSKKDYQGRSSTYATVVVEELVGTVSILVPAPQNSQPAVA